MKKHILCLGDSNTHGYCADPSDCADGGFAGVCAAREGDLALVQVTGHMTIPAADGLALGTRMVEMAGGKLAAAATGGRPAIVTALAEATAEIVLL